MGLLPSTNKKRGNHMKLPYKIVLVSLVLCIGFLPNSTGANFEPAKIVVFIENDNPGNYSLLQLAIDHAHQGQLQANNGALILGCSSLQQNTPLFTRLMFEGHKFQVPFQAISLLFSEELTGT